MNSLASDVDRREKRSMERARLQFGFIISGAWQSCFSCVEWDANVETCKLYKQRPPLHVIIVGCKSWDDVPF